MQSIRLEEVANEEKKLKRKKIAFCCLGLVLVPLSLVFTAFWCITAHFREVVVYPFVRNFKNFKTDDKLMLVEFHNRLRRAFIDFFLNLILLPIQLILFCVLLLPLLCLWIRSAVAGLWKLAGYIFSKESEIIASNRLKITTSDVHLETGEEKGSKVKTRVGAMLGYIFGIYNFDVEIFKTYCIQKPAVRMIHEISEEPLNVNNDTEKLEIPVLRDIRSWGCKWY